LLIKKASNTFIHHYILKVGYISVEEVPSHLRDRFKNIYPRTIEKLYYTFFAKSLSLENLIDVVKELVERGF